ncbi:SRPBCC domain-containing protein [Ciceribacter sp. L1K22]|uniref:SRPBCC family protein n=1 Tax=Ciceribacter sp. L1K22 TaxID=2820275 RepID=UPI001ABDBCF7|nr:SRPBCC domain-containing protein [Ciceribacter sp. L1K22]MBO3759438.1 SRPBCC domain-containing protein [Ciceribacter sp. L1K22]
MKQSIRPERQSPETQAIVLDDVFPHERGILWKALTNSALIARWLMPPIGFEPVVGTRFTFQTKPAGEWDGTIRCEVLEVIENERLSFSWAGGHEANEGYGSKLDTVVTFTLSEAESGTRLRLVHSGFVLPVNDSAYRTMGEGWKVVVGRLDTLAGEETPGKTEH